MAILLVRAVIPFILTWGGTLILASPSFVKIRYPSQRESGLQDTSYLRRATDSQNSTTNNLWVVSHDDFCLYGPPYSFEYISDTGDDVVSWCSQAGHGARLIPDGTLHGVTYVKTPDYVQVSGSGDFTKINIAPGDEGGQFDSVSNTPSGATMYVSDDGITASSWVTMISATTFCVRACTGNPEYCPTGYDQMGCWFLTGEAVGEDGVWQDCQSDDGEPPGVVGSTTYTQGNSPTPTPIAASLSACSTGSSVANGQTMPPMFSWDGSGTAVAITASETGSSSVDSGSDSSSSIESSSDLSTATTSWVVVTSCTPCEPSGTVTEQAGVTQISSNTSQALTATSSGDSDDLILRKRDSSSQCCYTSSIASLVTSTSTTNGSTVTSTAISPVNETVPGATSSGGLVMDSTTAASASTSASIIVSGSSLSPTASITSGSNSTNSSGISSSSSGAFPDVSGSWSEYVTASVVLLATNVLGGWLLV